MEIWKDIEGFEGYYQVSNLGNVKSLNYKRSGKAKLLSPKKHNKGYLQIQLNNGNANKTFTIHRLVAQAFISNPDKLPCVNHKDEDKTNNRAENLEWCSSKYNAKYSASLHPNRKKITQIQKVVQYDKNGNIIKVWDNAHSIYLETKMSDWSIAECCRGNRKSAYGYIWHYANEDITELEKTL